ncbi:unnamed protein product, partial [Prorocentrum cordatum]
MAATTHPSAWKPTDSSTAEDYLYEALKPDFVSSMMRGGYVYPSTDMKIGISGDGDAETSSGEADDEAVPIFKNFDAGSGKAYLVMSDGKHVEATYVEGVNGRIVAKWPKYADEIELELPNSSLVDGKLEYTPANPKGKPAVDPKVAKKAKIEKNVKRIPEVTEPFKFEICSEPLCFYICNLSELPSTDVPADIEPILKDRTINAKGGLQIAFGDDPAVSFRAAEFVAQRSQ